MILSIIIPVYNVEPFVEKCIRSCEAQDVSKDDYEIVVINDGFTDKSESVIRDYQQKYGQIILYSFVNQRATGKHIRQNRSGIA